MTDQLDSQAPFIDEGVIKFQLDWHQEKLKDDSSLIELIKYRNILAQHNCIGAYPGGIGFGNVSLRIGDSKSFYISGSQTGHIKLATADHFSLVSSCSVGKNSLTCIGEVKASSESLTHSMFYQLCPTIKAVVHIHHKKLWDQYKFKLPTTHEDIGYGTVEMAGEIKRLYTEDTLLDSKILVMAGHEEGLISFGQNLEDGTNLLLDLL
jgi:L-ribulose-5-phosphate 4-epimerase